MSKILKATHQGNLKIGDKILSCAVLEDRTRVIRTQAVFKAFGRIQRGGSRLTNIPVFMDAKNLQSFIDKDLMQLIRPITYLDKKDKKVQGYNAVILPKLCKIYLDAREAKVLIKQQLSLARASEILLIGLSNVGIIALVDEVTGYQDIRKRDELHKILEAYIAPELMPWTKRFPQEFYKEIFRLNGWDYEPKTVKRPSVIGSWTNKYIYEQLPLGVLKELKKQTPKDSKGRRKHHFHRLLTEDIGNPHLEKQIAAVVPIMRLSTTWRKFKENFAKAFQIGQKALEFKEENED